MRALAVILQNSVVRPGAYRKKEAGFSSGLFVIEMNRRVYFLDL